jgi:hypothetical protein
LTLPHFISRLNISGLTSGLLHLIQKLDQIVKLTLSETYLKEDALRILGKLPSLHCLKLQHKSYIETELGFKEEEFQCLNYLLVGSRDITKICFAVGAGPQLERIVSSFVAMHAISRMDHLPMLKKLEQNGETICLNVLSHS